MWCKYIKHLIFFYLFSIDKKREKTITSFIIFLFIYPKRYKSLYWKLTTGSFYLSFLTDPKI
jgi:hypothetical protein